MVNFCAAILIWKMEEDTNIFRILWCVISRKVKTQQKCKKKKICAEREKNMYVRETHQAVASSHMRPDQAQTHNLSMCPDQESNPWPFGLWDDAPTNWATLARAIFLFLKRSVSNSIFIRNLCNCMKQKLHQNSYIRFLKKIGNKCNRYKE